MSNNYLGDLVRQAKGEDRSLKEYAKDSGVDAAVISKIINGHYTPVPKRNDVYESLTSEEARPRNGITAEQLKKAANTENGFQAGLKVGKEIMENMIAAYGSVAVASIEPLIETGTSLMKVAKSVANPKSSKGTKGSIQEKTENVQKQIQRFVTLSKTIIYGQLALKGIQFSEKDGEYTNILGNIFDTYLSILNSDLKELIIRYVYIMPKEENNSFLIENTSYNIVGQLMFLPEDPFRKVMVMTNSRNVFNFLQGFEDKMSYKGNLSVALIDAEEYQLLKEKTLSTYN